MKKFAAIAIAAMLGASALIGMSACGKDEKTLKIGITYYEPMNYKDENGKLVGFDTEFAEKACAELGYTPEFVEIDWENKINELVTKKIDLIWNGMTISEELKDVTLRKDGILADLAPTLLEVMGLPIPPEMTGKSLIVK